jgi:hypothetical protein
MLAKTQEEQQASEADWEARMKEAVTSAEQWKEFAEKLGADKEATEAALAEAQTNLQVCAVDVTACLVFWPACIATVCHTSNS